MNRFFLGALGITAVASTPALAHTGLDMTSGLSAGLGHPVGGLDHVLAMVAVGILAAQMSSQSEKRHVLWAVPLTFVGLMALGGVLGMVGVGVPFVEQGIVGSVIILGAVIAWGRLLPQSVALGLVGILAVFHGHAHGTEMPMSASGLQYALGFMSATAVLHALGVSLTLIVQQQLMRWQGLTVRVGGGAIALGGLSLALG